MARSNSKARHQHVSLYEATAGLVTMLDPQRLTPGGAEGPMELAECVNIAIDERGMAELRHGSFVLQEGEFHSLFCDGGECFVVRERANDAAIMKVSPDGELIGVRSGLTKNKPMGWCEINGDTFYGNGSENGFIREGASHPWPTSDYHGPDADIHFAAAAPIAELIGFRSGGQMVIASGPAIFINHLPFDFGLWNLAGGAIGFDSQVRMLAMVRDGFFVSDIRRTWFFRKLEGWYHYKQELVSDAPALPGSLAHDRVNLRDMGLEEAEGFGRIWADADGLVLGMDNGTCLNLTKTKVRFPRCKTRGACIIKDNIVLHTTW